MISTMLNIFRSQGWLWSAIVLVLVGCSPSSSPEAEIRDWVTQAVASAEARNVRDLRALIADDYTDERGLDRQAVENLIRLHVLRQQSIHVFVRIRSIEFPEPDHALTSIATALAGKPVTRANDLVGLTADLYRFDLDMIRQGGEWRVRGAKWEPARLDDFL